MKKLLSMLKVKGGASSDEEPQQATRKPEDVEDSDNSTKDKESTSDEQNQREAKKEEIKRSMQDRKATRFQKVLS